MNSNMNTTTAITDTNNYDDKYVPEEDHGWWYANECIPKMLVQGRKDTRTKVVITIGEFEVSRTLGTTEVPPCSHSNSYILLQLLINVIFPE